MTRLQFDKQTTVLFEPDQRAFIEAEADRERLSMADVIRRALRFYMAAKSANSTSADGNDARA